MKKLVTLFFLGTAMSLSAQESAPNVDIKTNPIGFIAGNYSAFMESPIKNPYVTFNLGAWIWASELLGSGGGASVGVRRYFNENMEGTFIGLYARAYQNEVFSDGVGGLGFTVGKKQYLGDFIPLEYYAGLGRATGVVYDFVWGLNIGINPMRSQLQKQKR